jgi:hypothetical protein
MSTGIRPIETQYKGYRFRSRLEARWAVFFDALGLPWEYEPEGFETPAGRYLPDFRVTSPDGFVVYVEVRPTNELEIRVHALNEVLAGTRAHCQFVWGDPAAWLEYRMRRGEGRGTSWLELAFPRKQTLDAADAATLAAAKVARGARFEFGETPA